MANIRNKYDDASKNHSEKAKAIKYCRRLGIIPSNKEPSDN